MSAGGAFGGARGYQPKPPDKGVFPLDHFGECKQAKEEYMACLKQHGNQAESCRSLAKHYLECRMERNLMARQDLKELGFQGSGSTSGQDSSTKATRAEQAVDREVMSEQQGSDSSKRKREGFIAGLRR
ncbi:g2586 [Coccomyxa viridis]|uniref:G2586 protein n=1 Tax=Coccomyxa viridis TaxID=1274662 RepID=A0ABP1FKQ4_9CHLO